MLSEIPTSDLLAEIQRRCDIASYTQLALRLPAWSVGVVERVAALEQITPRELVVNETRTHAAAMPRMLAMAALEHLYPGRALEQIARIWKKDHGTVIHARRRIAALVATEPAMAEKWRIIIGQESPHGHCRSARQVISRCPDRKAS